MDPYFILTLFQHGYKVRTSTLYHLLKGKRTSSVLIYGFMYQNLRFFQLTPELTEAQFNKFVNTLLEDQLLNKDKDGNVQLTVAGDELLKSQKNAHRWINNYRFGKTDEEIWRFLQFMVQVVSHLSYNNKQYVPLEQSPLYQGHLKKRLTSLPRAELIKKLKTDWYSVFSQLSKEEADYFAMQFSGYQQIGKAAFQLLDETIAPFDRYLLKKERLHQLLFLIENLAETSFLKETIQPFLQKNENQSMNETKLLLKKHLSVEEIAWQRKMKKSTIQDHLIELALTEQIFVDRYISAETYHYLDKLQAPCEQWIYRSLKKENDTLDYFEYRLYQIQKLRKERDV
jgi:uncharacterized protein YpbB